jgi:hypothetical protein
MLSLSKHLYRFIKLLYEAVEMLRQAQHDTLPAKITIPVPWPLAGTYRPRLQIG